MYQDAEEMSLKQKTLKGLSWSFIDSFSSQLISFVVMIVLARMLEPEEFGILGYIFIFVSLAGPFIEGGFAQALIKKTNCTTADYSTAFFFNFAMGIVTAGLLYVAAPLISHLLAVPQMTPMLRVMGIFFIICAVGTIQGTIFTKKLDFKTKALVSIGSSTLAGVIAIIMAYCGLGVWSLIWRIILGGGFGSLVLWLISDWRPSFIFSKQKFKELFGFGYKFFLSDLIRNIYDNLYYPVVGRFFSPAALGFYTRAENFSYLFSSTLATNVQRVSYPAMATIQNDVWRLKHTYRKMLKSTMIITFSCLLGLAAVAHPLIHILIGDKWLPSVTFLQLMCLSAMFVPLHAMTMDLMAVKGRPDIFLKMELLIKSLTVPLIAIGIFYGIEALLIGKIVVAFIAFGLDAHYASRLAQYSVKEMLADVAPLLAVALGVSLTVWSIDFLHCNEWLTLIVQITTGVALTIGLYELIKQKNYLEMKQIVLSFIRKFLPL